MIGRRIIIHKLTEFPAEGSRLLTAGYTSNARYTARKTESAERTEISLTLEKLSKPYVRQWDRDLDMEQYYAKVIVEQRLSLGAYDGDKLVAVAITEARRWNRSLWVWEFHILEDYKRQGLGRIMMDGLAELAEIEKLRLMVCETQNTNAPAIQFYKAVGFEIDAVDLSYYDNRGAAADEVALFMKRKLEG
jgi:ribosomal protein S18 acetylase RimI-like enzyme